MSGFQDDGAVIVRGFLGSDLCQVATTYALATMRRSYQADGEVGVETAHSLKGDALTQALLLEATFAVSQLTGRSLIPSWAFARVYVPGNELKEHVDEYACDVSVSITVGAHYPDGYPGWPLMLRSDPLMLNPGDAVVFDGRSIPHSRPKFEVPDGCWQVQMFLFYIYEDSQFSSEYSKWFGEDLMIEREVH